MLALFVPAHLLALEISVEPSVVASAQLLPLQLRIESPFRRSHR